MKPPKFQIGDVVVVTQEQKELINAFDPSVRPKADPGHIPWTPEMDPLVNEVLVIHHVYGIPGFLSFDRSQASYTCYAANDDVELADTWEFREDWLELAPEHIANPIKIGRVI
jgi:hypothetical protein